MPATASRIGFIKEEFRRVVAETPTVSVKHGNLARESDDPIETFFDSTADAQLVATARQALLSPERRRFRCETASLEELMALTYVGAVPLGRFRDSERSADRKVLVGEIVLDFQKQHGAAAVWG